MGKKRLSKKQLVLLWSVSLAGLMPSACLFFFGHRAFVASAETELVGLPLFLSYMAWRSWRKAKQPAA